MNHREGCEAREFTRTHPIGAHAVVVRCLSCGAVHLEQLEQLEPDNTQHPHHTDRDEATP